MLTILYRSEAVTLLPFSALTDICLESTKRNQREGITGFLVERHGVFLQVLEGGADAVDALYTSITRDPRHHNVELLLHEERDANRNFGFWAMNFGPLNDPSFWEAVFSTPLSLDEFRQRSHNPEFALGVLTRAYWHARVVANADPMLRAFVQGAAVPRSDGAATE